MKYISFLKSLGSLETQISAVLICVRLAVGRGAFGRADLSPRTLPSGGLLSTVAPSLGPHAFPPRDEAGPVIHSQEEPGLCPRQSRSSVLGEERVGGRNLLWPDGNL